MERGKESSKRSADLPGSGIHDSAAPKNSRLRLPPLFPLAAAFTAGIAAARIRPDLTAGIGPWWIISVCFALLFICMLPTLRRIRRPGTALLLYFSLGAAAGWLAAPGLPAPPALEPFFERPQTVFLAEVAGPADFYPDKTRIPLNLGAALTGPDFVPVRGGVLLTLPGARKVPLDIAPGDRLIARLSLKRFHSFQNPGGYDYARSQAEKGLHARAFLKDERSLVKLAPESGFFAASIVSPMRARIERFRQESLFWLQNELDPDTAAFYAALLLGYQHLLSSEWQNHANRAGVTHLLSIGGMHLSLVSLAVFWIVRRSIRILCPSLLHSRDDQHLALFPALAAAVLYAVLSGFAVAPIWRSTVMLLLAFAAACKYRTADPLSVLAAAALLILAVSPNSIGNIPFQLTFLCMFAIISIYPLLQRLESPNWHPVFSREKVLGKILHPFEEAFWVSVAVNVAVIPLTVYYFQGVSLACFAANIVLVPVVGFLVIPPGLASIAVFAANETLALPILKLGAWFLTLSKSVILWFSNLSWAFFWVGTVPVALLVCFYGALFLLLSAVPRRAKAASMAAILLLACGIFAADHIPALSEAHGRLEVTAVDVGQGTSTLVRFPSGESMLVDGGGYYDDSFDIGRSVLAPFLWSLGVRRLDFVVLSHDHPDHANGLRFLLSHFNVGAFWETGVATAPGGSSQPRRIAERRRIPVERLPEILRDRQLGQCRLRVLHPTAEYIRESWNGDLNNASLVLQIDHGETSVILPGDVDSSVEEHLLRRASFSGANLLIAPHHGSDRSTSRLLLDRLQPRAVIFSCGFDNLFGFPSERILEECRKRGVPHFRTDLCGAVTARSDGKQWSIKTMTPCTRAETGG